MKLALIGIHAALTAQATSTAEVRSYDCISSSKDASTEFTIRIDEPQNLVDVKFGSAAPIRLACDPAEARCLIKIDRIRVYAGGVTDGPDGLREYKFNFDRQSGRVTYDTVFVPKAGTSEAKGVITEFFGMCRTI